MRVQHDAFTRPGRAGNQQVRHRFERRHFDPAADIFAERHGHRRLRISELVGLQDLAQADDFALAIGDFDTYGRFAWYALDEYGFHFEPEAQIFGQGRDTAVLYASFGLELKRRNDRARD